MVPDDECLKLRFDLANKNLQSVSRAQGLYLTALLVYICLVWAMYLTGTTTLKFESLELKIDAVWKITPFVTVVLTLAVVGTLNAAISAYAQVKEAGNALLGPDFGTLFAVDTYKNVIDYLALLQILPWGRTHTPADSHGNQSFLLRLRHLIFPSLFLFSISTSIFAVRQITSNPRFFVVFGWACLAFQALFSIRPMWRWFQRLRGVAATHDAYN
jgi:hypothetical protein